LSPDGSQRAIVVYGPKEKPSNSAPRPPANLETLLVNGWEGLKNIDWSADGRSTLDGKASVLLHSSNPEVFYAIPSPDHRLLAIVAASNQNVGSSKTSTLRYFLPASLTELRSGLAASRAALRASHLDEQSIAKSES